MGKGSAMFKMLGTSVPRWALVILAGIGVLYLADLHTQIKEDHKMLQRHEVEIKAIQKRL